MSDEAAPNVEVNMRVVKGEDIESVMSLMGPDTRPASPKPRAVKREVA